MLSGNSFHRFVREERLFCATLAHLLMEKGPNLTRFLQLVGRQLPDGVEIATAGLQAAQIYIEFTYLRDYWNKLERDNDEKRRFVVDRIARVSSLSRYRDQDFPLEIADFNTFFMGDRGRSITKDIVYPGQWTVAALAERFGAVPAEFRDLCRFKWTFNIKPDLVVLMPGARPLCVEAKLESKEGRYPTRVKECKTFDDIFGREQGRVSQVELQKFMFDVILDDRCDQVVIGRTAPVGGVVPFLAWREVFQELDLSSSVPFVQALITENQHLARRQP